MSNQSFFGNSSAIGGTNTTGSFFKNNIQNKNMFNSGNDNNNKGTSFFGTNTNSNGKIGSGGSSFFSQTPNTGAGNSFFNTNHNNNKNNHSNMNNNNNNNGLNNTNNNNSGAGLSFFNKGDQNSFFNNNATTNNGNSFFNTNNKYNSTTTANTNSFPNTNKNTSSNNFFNSDYKTGGNTNNNTSFFNTGSNNYLGNNSDGFFGNNNSNWSNQTNMQSGLSQSNALYPAISNQNTQNIPLMVNSFISGLLLNPNQGIGSQGLQNSVTTQILEKLLEESKKKNNLEEPEFSNHSESKQQSQILQKFIQENEQAKAQTEYSWDKNRFFYEQEQPSFFNELSQKQKRRKKFFTNPKSSPKYFSNQNDNSNINILGKDKNDFAFTKNNLLKLDIHVNYLNHTETVKGISVNSKCYVNSLIDGVLRKVNLFGHSIRSVQRHSKLFIDSKQVANGTQLSQIQAVTTKLICLNIAILHKDKQSSIYINQTYIIITSRPKQTG